MVKPHRPQDATLTATLDPTLVASPWAEELFDLIGDMVFFIKDVAGRYVVVNRTLVDRCGLATKAQALGRTAADLFPAPLGDRFLAQDIKVCRTGSVLANCLELHIFPNHSEGWCVTDKVPLRDQDGSIVGLVGVSRDVRLPAEDDPRLHDLAAALRHIQEGYGEELRVETLATLAGMSVYRFNRRVRVIFGLTAGQLITKTRIDAASHLLRTTVDPLAAIALACGYNDQSAFTRQFKATVGLTPGQYRDRYAPRPGKPLASASVRRH